MRYSLQNLENDLRKSKMFPVKAISPVSSQQNLLILE